MTDVNDHGIVERLDPVFEAWAGRATTALWSPGRCIILVVHGQEQEFACRNAAAEARMLARLKEHGTTILPEAGPRKVVFAIAATGLVVLLLLSVMT